MSESVNVFGPDGNVVSFDSAGEAHRYALRERLYGGRIEITDEFGGRIVEQIVWSEDLSRQNIEFILGPFQPSELEVFEMTVIQGQVIHGFDALLSQPKVREVAQFTDITVRLWNPSLSDDWFMGVYDGDALISMAPGQTFQDTWGSVGKDVEDHLDDG